MHFTDAIAFAFDGQLTTFGEKVVVGGFEMLGIFDRGYLPVDVGGQVAMASTAPTLTIKEGIVTLTTKTAVSVRGEGYSIIDIQPDGAGTVRLVLREA